MGLGLGMKSYSGERHRMFRDSGERSYFEHPLYVERSDAACVIGQKACSEDPNGTICPVSRKKILESPKKIGRQR